MVQNSTKYVPWKYYKAVASDLKPIYQSVTEEEALLEFDNFCSRWDNKYPK
jgi:putative transposase